MSLTVTVRVAITHPPAPHQPSCTSLARDNPHVTPRPHPRTRRSEAKPHRAWAGTESAGGVPDVVLACAGDVPTLEVLAAADIPRRELPELRTRVVNVVD